MSKALLYNVSVLIEETKELSDRLKALESKQLNTERWLDSMSTTVEAVEEQFRDILDGLSGKEVSYNVTNLAFMEDEDDDESVTVSGLGALERKVKTTPTDIESIPYRTYKTAVDKEVDDV
ncbi:hypothetical protein CMI37_31965 [Candidatus Pacearchaeota archaeon]|nr:hypothetical protein [Candidatus Pacearchaeota archaeon]